MRLNVFFQNAQNLMYMLKIQQNLQKKSFVFGINAFKLVAVISPYYSEKYLASAANWLKNSPKILDLTKRDVVQLFLFWDD